MGLEMWLRAARVRLFCEPMTLDIGCGKRKIEPDSIGIDASADSAADKVWNLDRYPWPLDDGQFSRVHMSHVIEHLEDPMRAMAEVYRVAQDGADVFVITPHFSSHNSYVDPTHRRHPGQPAVNPPGRAPAPRPWHPAEPPSPGDRTDTPPTSGPPSTTVDQHTSRTKGA